LDRDKLPLLIVAVLAILLVGYIALKPVYLAGANETQTNTASDSTPYGESLEIKIGSGSSTSGQASVINVAFPASWLASYTDSSSQNVYTVDGVYKSQEQVTLSYSLTVTYANVENIEATVKIKAIDAADSSFYEYTLANGKALSGASPISDNGQVVKSITEHLTDIDASTSGATVQYQIYAQVTGTGAVSGETLTAEVPYTQFGELVYQQSSESSSAEVTPTVSVASYVDDLGSTLADNFWLLVLAGLLAACMIYLVKEDGLPWR